MADVLLDGYVGLVCDLDGVVYAGPTAIPHAVESLEAARERGVGIVYATNNASRPPEKVAHHLSELGLTVNAADVVNSSMAAAHVLGASGDDVETVLAIGGEGVQIALEAAGYTCVRTDEVAGPSDTVDAVVQGYGSDVRAADLASAAHAVANGARWVATNTDLTLPTERGIAPGNGSLVQAVRNAVGIDPEVAGKPMPVMYDMAAERFDGEGRVLAVGDRLETDIEGACRGGYDSVLVLTGVHDLADAAAAPPHRRPTYVVEDLRALLAPYAVSGGAQSSTIEALRARLVDLWKRVDAGEISADEAREAMTAAMPS